MILLRSLATALVSLILVTPSWRESPSGLRLSLPVRAAVVRPFQAPEHPYGPGHRGVDLSADAGTEVRAAADGVVTFAGRLAHRGVISVTHDLTRRLRTTYEPVSAIVKVGDRVRAGQVIGHVEDADHDGLHWGLVDGETYLDPLLFLEAGSARPIRLLPVGHSPRPVPPVPSRTPGAGVRPADGPITSAFGLRLHPILKRWRVHDGVDLGAPCHSPVRSVASGVVIRVDTHAAYGWRVWIDHGDGRRTGYTHLSAFAVQLGDRVEAGSVLGRVGNTGWSTGCHLHFMAWDHGRVVDPTGWLPR